MNREDSIYLKMVERARAAWPKVSFQAMRVAYTHTSLYDPYGFQIGDLAKEMRAAADAGDYKTALARARELLDREYVNIEAHHVSFVASRELGDEEAADYHFQVARQLIGSILGSGDGKSEDTAYRVVTIGEEYILLDVLGLSMEQQSLVHNTAEDSEPTEDSRCYDLIQARNDDDQKRDIYFDITIPFSHMQRKLKNPASD